MISFTSENINLKKSVILILVFLFAEIFCGCNPQNPIVSDNISKNEVTDITTTKPSATEEIHGSYYIEETVIKDEVVHLSYYSYYSESLGYKISGYDQSAGKEYHHFYHTSDGGCTWKEIETNFDAVCPQYVTGISFINESIGFITCRYRSNDFNPAILKTENGGVTWEKQINICDMLNDYSFQGYYFEASNPFFKDGILYVSIKAIRHNEKDDDITFFTIMSEDYENWVLYQ